MNSAAAGVPAGRAAQTARPRRFSTRIRRSTCAALAIGLIAAAPVVTATPAHAWTWDSNVTVWGWAGCKTTDFSPQLPAEQVWLYVYDTGEIVQTGVDWTEFYAAHLHTIPAGGSWSDLWVYCAVPGETAGWRYAGRLFIDRPWVTDFDGPVDPTV